MTLPDVVYVVRPGDGNEELRYSLRSLVNLPHRRVWIAGHRPRWVTGVGHIRVKHAGTKYQSATDNIRAAVAHPEVADDLVWFNDDFFVMKPLDEVPVLHAGPVAQVIARYERRFPDGSPYVQGMAAAARYLAGLGVDDPLSYELHVPFPANKARLAEVLGLPGQGTPRHTRTVYGNYWRIGGQQANDVKVSRLGDRWSRTATFLSTTDLTFRRTPVGAHIRRAFPHPGPYERR